MKHLTIYLLRLIIVFLFSSCSPLHEDENYHYRIYFENHWDKPIYIWYDIDWHWYDNPYENYASLFAEKTIYETEVCHKILPGGIDCELMKHRDYFECELQVGDSVVVSVFDAELPGKKDSECFLVRYHLSREDLKKVNYHISFPPTDAMKDFYMRPSYDEVISRYKGNGADS